jgi:hypothetical protein
VGKKMAEGLVEVVDRKTKQVVDVPVGQTIDLCRQSLGRR